MTSVEHVNGLRKLEESFDILVAKNEQKLQIAFTNNIAVTSSVNGREVELDIVDVYVTEGLRHNLFSVRRVESRGGEIIFKGGKAIIRMAGRVIAIGRMRR